MAQVWLVTGSSRGLGRAIVEAGLLAGNEVLATARDIESLRELSERYGDQVKLFELDVTDESSAAGAVKTAIDAFGSLDVVINNAGYGNLSSVEDTPMSDFRAQIETNLFGTIIVTKAALPYFRERKGGPFGQFSSMGGRSGPPGRGPYAAAKWGVEGFSEVLSREVAPLGIKVTIIEPGGFRTDFAGSSTKLSEGHPEYDSTVGATARFQRAYNGKQPGDPKKAAQAIVQLTQERNPPLRLLLGSDAYNGAEKNDLARLEEARSWKELSLSTDFESKPPHPERPKRTYLSGNPAHGRAKLIPALGAGSGRMTSNPKVIRASAGLVLTSALVLTGLDTSERCVGRSEIRKTYHP